MEYRGSKYDFMLLPPEKPDPFWGGPWQHAEKEKIYKEKYKVYQIQQKTLNPDNLPRNSSIYKHRPNHLDLWIEDTFFRNFDRPAFESLTVAWSHAQQYKLPFKDICHDFF